MAYLAVNLPIEGFDSVPFVYSAILVQDGKVELAGNCGSSIEQQLREWHGDSFDLLATEIPVLVAGDISRMERVVRDEPSQDEIVLLNSASVSGEFLDTLEEAVLVFEVNEAVSREKLICVETTAGWNDCLPVGLESFQKGEEVVHDIFLSDDGVIKVWMLDSVNLADKKSRSLIGEVILDPLLLSRTELAVMSIAIEPAGRSAEANISDAVAIEDLDPKSELGSLLLEPVPDASGQ